MGDVVYSFGEHTYYYDQFYDAFRNYPAPVFAIPGNHDGLVPPVAPPPGSAGNPTRVKKEKFAGAVILAVHHPPYTFGKHVTSMVMLKQIDAICSKLGVWPHAVLSGHAHNYQRFTRNIGKRQIPYVVCGNGGHPPIQKIGVDTKLRTPIGMPGFAQPERGDSRQL